MEEREIAGINHEIARDKEGKFLPGVSPNPAGKPKGVRHMTTLLQEAIKKVAEGDAEPADIMIVKKLITKAKEGEFKHTELIFDRLEGKAPQKIEVEGIGENNLSELKEITEKLNAIYRSTGIGSNGGSTGTVGS